MRTRTIVINMTDKSCENGRSSIPQGLHPKSGFEAGSSRRFQWGIYPSFGINERVIVDFSFYCVSLETR